MSHFHRIREQVWNLEFGTWCLGFSWNLFIPSNSCFLLFAFRFVSDSMPCRHASPRIGVLSFGTDARVRWSWAGLLEPAPGGNLRNQKRAASGPPNTSHTPEKKDRPA